MKILDSDHCVAILRGRLKLQGQIVAVEELGVTTISVAELVHGAHKSARSAENLARVDALLAGFTIIPFDEPAARRFGLAKAELERAGIVGSDLDLQIASIALEHTAPLITHNRRHFERVPGLVIEDWL